MGVGIQNVYSQIGSTDQTMSVTVSSGATMLVVCVGIHQGTVVDVQANSVSLTRSGAVSATAFDERVEIWYQYNPTVGTYDVFFDGTGGSGRAVVAYVLTETRISGQPSVFAIANGSGSTASVSITPTSNNNLIIDSHYSEDIFTTVGANQTSRANLQGSNSYDDFATSTTLQTTAGAEVMSWSINTGQRWASAAISIEPAFPTTSIKLETGTFLKLETGNRIGIE